MKHEKMIRRLISEWHEPWMDEQDKANFDEETIRQFGAQFDADIEKGIANGHTAEEQEEIVRAIFKEMSKFH